MESSFNYGLLDGDGYMSEFISYEIQWVNNEDHSKPNKVTIKKPNNVIFLWNIVRKKLHFLMITLMSFRAYYLLYI